MESWIKIFQKIRDWQFYKNTPLFSLWLHLLIEANWQDREWNGMVIKRGSLITTVKALCDITGLTTEQVRYGLLSLTNTKQITKQTTNKFTIITICNYESYQGIRQTKPQTSHKQIPTITPITTDNIDIPERKKDNTNVLSKESEHPEFDELMEQFPTVQKMEKPLTFEEYTRAVEAYSQDEVVDTLGQMENKRGLSKLYVSANLTLRKWLQLHRERQGGGKGDNPHPEIKLGIKEFFDNGRRTYGDGTYTIPLDAPPRPSERHYWNTSTHQWLI